MRIILVVFLLAIALSSTFAQEKKEKIMSAFNYAFVSVEGTLFSKKLKVEVDLGDRQEQIDVGKKYSEILSNRKSYTAILNYMTDEGFELVQTLTLESSSSYSGSGAGGTSGVIFIMRVRK